MKKKIPFILLLLFTLILVNTSAQQLTQKQKDSMLTTYVNVPNTNVKLIPPAYFKPFVKDGKFGFMHEGASSTISFQIITGTPYMMIVPAMNEEFFKKQGVTLLSTEDVKTKSGKEGKMFIVGFKVKSKDGKLEYDYERIMFFTGDISQTIWINANYPAVIKKMLFDVLKVSLLTVQF